MAETTFNHPISKIVQHISLWFLMVFIFLMPLAFNPFSLVNAFDFPKWVLVVITALLMLLFVGIVMVFERKAFFVAPKYLIPIGVFAVALLVSVFLSPSADTFPTKMALLYGKVGLLLGFIIILLTSLILVKDKIKNIFLPLVLSGFILSWLQIFAFLGILPKVLKAQVFSAKTFTPMGSQLALATFLVIVLAMLIVIAIKTKERSKKILLFIIAGVEAVALFFSVAQMLPGQPAAPKLLPYSIGWSVLLDQLKNSVTAFFGAGPDAFAVAFSKFRPAMMNQTVDWFIRFNNSSNEWFTLFTTIGLVGVAAFGFMILSFIRGAMQSMSESPDNLYKGVGLLLTILLITVIPGNIATLFLLYILAIMVIGTDEDSVSEYEHPILPLVLSGVTLGVLIFFGLNLGKAVIAEAHFAKSINYANENKGNDTYYSQIEAIKNNPYAVRYRISYSNTNLALANSLASKENLTDEDRTTITQLVTQSIREAKAAVALDPQNSTNWVNLASIYRQLINFAQGADQWAVSSYVQAIRLDGSNPQLRLDLGGLLYSLGSYDTSIDQFKQAISLKQDYPNAYYNLSHAYIKLEQYPQAYAAMQNVVGLIDVNSADHEKALTELKQLQELLPKENRPATPSAQRQSELQEPEPVPSPKNEQVKFDDGQKKEMEPPVGDKTGFGEIVEEATGSGETQPEATPVLTPTPAE